MIAASECRTSVTVRRRTRRASAVDFGARRWLPAPCHAATSVRAATGGH